jgi:hypothetical protein
VLNNFIIAGKLSGAGPLAMTGRVDGATIDAIRAFQRKYVGMQSPDGRVDPGGGTLLKLNGSLDQPASSTAASSRSTSACASPSPLKDVAANLGASALGFCSRTLRRYGVPETVQALLYIGTVWHNRHPNGPIIIVSDVSQCGGGKISPHGSHRVGLDVDLGFRMKRSSSCNSGERVCTGGGARKQTADYVAVWRPLIKELIEIITANPYLPVKIIWFKDKELERLFRRPDGTRLVSTSEPGHDCHLHVRFCMPQRVRSSLDLGAVYGPGEQRANYSCG